MKPAGLHHLAICVADAQEGLAFYHDVLGMTQLPRPNLGPGHWLAAGGQQVHLMESNTQPRAANHFAIRVDDIDAAVTDFRSRVSTCTGFHSSPEPGAKPSCTIRSATSSS